MDEEKLVVLLQAEERSAVGYYNSEISGEQEQALKYYHGEPFGNEEEGRSSVVSRDVATTIDSMMPDLIRPFLSGDHVVEFAPTKQGDEKYAEQATDYVNYIFFKDNDGFSITHDWAKDGLMNKIGVVKAYWDEKDDERRETYENLSEDALLMLSQEAEIIEATTDEESGLTDVTVIRREDNSQVKIECVPPEEFLVSSSARQLEGADYVAHKCQKTRSELVEMGFDKKLVMGLTSEDDHDFDERATERYKDVDYNFTNDSTDETMQRVWVLEEYVLVDYDGDGIAEQRKITRVNKEILENVPVEEHPFIDFTPIKLSHRVYGKSVADDTSDIQLIKSTLIRQALDNLYITNNPRIEVPDAVVGEDTFDDLLTPRPGAPIRTRGAGGLKPIAIPFTAGNTSQMVEYWDGEKEERTGVTRLNQGLDADTLNKTATGVALIQNKGMGKIELIARNLANSFGILFRKILRLVVKYQERERIVMLRGQWVPMQPDLWNADMRVREQVGLGTGDKQERIQMRMAILDIQREALQMGFVKPEHLYNNVSKLIKDMELGEGEDYFVDPKNVPPQEDKPSAEEMEAQAQMQIEQQKLQLDKMKADAEIEMQREKAQAQIQADREKAALQLQLAREKAQAEIELAREKMALEAAIAQEKMNHDISNNRPGGDLSK